MRLTHLENLEKKTKENNGISVTVEDKNENMKKLKELIPEIESVEMVKDNEDGTKQYTIISKADTDLRKKLFDVLPKQDITIFELKKTETTLEDAFIKLIDTKKEGEKIMWAVYKKRVKNIFLISNRICGNWTIFSYL